METTKKTTTRIDLLTAVEQIVELSKNSHLEPEFFSNATRPINYLSKKMGLSKNQAVMMALFIDNSNDMNINIRDFANHLDCSTTRVLRLMTDIDELVNRGLICCSNVRNGVTYRVPWEVVDAFKRNEKFVPRSYAGLSCQELFGIVEEIMEMRDDNEISTELAQRRINELLDANRHLAPEIDTIIIPTAQEYSHISSSAVRDVVSHHGDLSQFIPEGVVLPQVK